AIERTYAYIKGVELAHLVGDVGYEEGAELVYKSRIWALEVLDDAEADGRLVTRRPLGGVDIFRVQGGDSCFLEEKSGRRRCFPRPVVAQSAKVASARLPQKPSIVGSQATLEVIP